MLKRRLRAGAGRYTCGQRGDAAAPGDPARGPQSLSALPPAGACRKWPPLCPRRRRQRFRAPPRRFAATGSSTSSALSACTGRAMSEVAQASSHRRPYAEYEEPAPRPARQRLRRPTHHGDAVRLNRHSLLQSITFLWDRPAGPAPAPIYSERATHLSRVFSLAPPQSPVILQADTRRGDSPCRTCPSATCCSRRTRQSSSPTQTEHEGAACEQEPSTWAADRRAVGRHGLRAGRGACAGRC